MVKDRLLTAKQAAKIIGVSLAAMHHRMRRGQIPAVKMGERWRIRESDLQAYIASLKPPYSDGPGATEQPHGGDIAEIEST